MGIEETLQQIFPLPSGFHPEKGIQFQENILTFTHYIQSPYVAALEQYLRLHPLPEDCLLSIDPAPKTHRRKILPTLSLQEISFSYPTEKEPAFANWLNQHAAALRAIAGGKRQGISKTH